MSEGARSPSGAALLRSTLPRMPVKRLRESAVLPAYQTAGAAGLDLCACPDDGAPITIPPGAIRLIGTGLAVAIPDGFEGQVRPRSGLAVRFGISMPNTPGTIDSDYRGEVKVPLINLGPEPFVAEPGMRIAQLVIAPVARVEVEETSGLDPTSRGHGGFGSTGV